ncbi:LCP family protein [Amycolatopsis suaedae]|uniref:LytR family transcriptional regulator n=1 Tax=Amycolatopsis suaedae TaxID=2510978 RepID=A0A4V2ELT8_9PSEU|nr:LCP family protein [Amycolatopsis suaedae]RZQ62715.1 LytR family transcriptional regulator [Amycolatopsis suaedae]
MTQTVIAIASVVVLAAAWYGWQVIGDPNQGLATTNVFDGGGLQKKPLDGAVDILLVGQDSRTDNEGNPLPPEILAELHGGKADGERQTDTMILVHIPQNGERAVAISFPRDTLVELAGGYGKHKLNSAFVYAYNDTFGTLTGQGTDIKAADAQAKIAGRKNLIATIENLLGKPKLIDRYAEVNLFSFAEVTKAMGGVEVCLKAPVKEWRSGVDLPAGPQLIEGKQALSFVRQRYDLPNSDLDRIARQQAFLSGLARKVLSPDVLMNPVRIADVINAVKKSVVLSEGWDLMEFAEQMRGLTGGKVEFRTIPIVGDAKFGGADVLKIDEQQVRTFFERMAGDGAAAPGGPQPPAAGIPGADAVTVDVINATGRSATGTEVRDLVRGKGFRDGSDTSLNRRQTTVIRYAPSEAANAELLKQALGGQYQFEPDRNVPKGHVRVLLGADYKPPAAPPASSQAAPPPSQPPAQQVTEPPAADQPITAGGVPCVN